MANLRFEVVAEAFKKRPVEVEAPKVRPSEYFAKYVFNRQKMYKYLPSDVYEKLIDVIDNGSRLDRSIADAVAAGMKLWAEENGVTHYTHWFQPLTEGTAEKHDAFVGNSLHLDEPRRHQAWLPVHHLCPPHRWLAHSRHSIGWRRFGARHCRGAGPRTCRCRLGRCTISLVSFHTWKYWLISQISRATRAFNCRARYFFV